MMSKALNYYVYGYLSSYLGSCDFLHFAYLVMHLLLTVLDIITTIYLPRSALSKIIQISLGCNDSNNNNYNNSNSNNTNTNNNCSFTGSEAQTAFVQLHDLCAYYAIYTELADKCHCSCHQHTAVNVLLWYILW